MFVLGAASIGQLKAQTFFEDFQQGIPGTWTLYNEDSLTPNVDVAFVTDAWVTNDDGASDTFATSTSYYGPPAGAADDWLVTPAITLTTGEILSWQGRAQDPDFPDGYQVRISTTGNAVADFLANPALFTTAAENDVWTNHFVNLAALGYANQTVYIAFRNTSNDQFLLHIDDVQVDNTPFVDGALTLNAIEYTAIPERQLEPFLLSTTIDNISPGVLSDAYVSLTIFNGNNQVIYIANSDTVSLAAGLDTTLFFSSWTPTTNDLYSFQYLLVTSATDINAANDTVFDFVQITDTTYARDIFYLLQGQTTQNSVGIGAGSTSIGNYLGQSYEITEATALTSVTAAFVRPTANDTSSIAVFRITNGIPGALVAESELYFFPDTNYQEYTFTFSDVVVLDVDTYAIVVREYSQNAAIGVTTQKFTPGTVWINWPTIPTGGWTNAELFGPNFARTFLIRPNFGACPVSIDTAYVLAPTCAGELDGYVILEATPNFGALGFDWSNGDTDSIAEFLTNEVYTVTVSDDLGCESTGSYNFSNVTDINVNITSSNASTPTSNDGEASVTANGGVAPYTYEWSNDSTTSTITGLGAGVVRVTVTDANGCESVGVDTISAGVGITVISSLSANIYPNPANTQVSIEATLKQAGDVQIVVMNNLGQAVIRQTEAATQVLNATLNISNLPAGIYLIQVSSGDASTTQKLIVE